MPAQILLGTSGFVYPHWRHGVFYPEGLRQAKELEYYADHFHAVELNNPFYRLPNRDTFVSWKERTPRDFQFAVKASRFITHIKRLRDCRDPVRTFFAHARGLSGKLGPVLFQLPPTMHSDVQRLRDFSKVLSRKRRCVFEFRHESWFTEAVYDVLAERALALCIAIGGRLEAATIPFTAPFVYLRMHVGRGKDGAFTRTQLKEWAERVRGLADEGMDVYVFFNNDWEGFAIRNALDLGRLLQL
jgi:uncharacterized protein YecE (DUF72 family)